MTTPTVHTLLAAIAIVAAMAEPRELPRMSRLADGVYLYEHPDPTKRGVTANNLVVVSGGGVLVTDGQGTPDNTRQLVDAVAAVTAQPIRYVVVGSEHGDHRGGDSAFPPTAVFIAHPFSRDNLDRQAHAADRRPNAPPTVVPAETVADERVLNMTGADIHVLFLGRGHTGGDLEVFLPQKRIAYVSEMSSSGIFPSMANAYPGEWLRALDRIERLQADTFVPAHGLMDRAPALDRAELHAFHLALERVVTEGRRLHDAHVAVDDAPARADFGPYASWARAAENGPSAIKRVYMEADGTLR